MADHSARQLFFVDREDTRNAMMKADSEFRFASLAELGCTALDLRAFEVVAGAVDPDAPEVDFAKIVPPLKS